MKRQLTKQPKIALCRACHGTGHVIEGPEGRKVVCSQCMGSGRVTVSANIELDIRPYKPQKTNM